MVFVEGLIHVFQYLRNDNFRYELWKKILCPWILNPTNVSFSFNPRKLVPTKIKPSTVIDWSFSTKNLISGIAYIYHCYVMSTFYWNEHVKQDKMKSTSPDFSDSKSRKMTSSVWYRIFISHRWIVCGNHQNAGDALCKSAIWNWITSVIHNHGKLYNKLIIIFCLLLWAVLELQYDVNKFGVYWNTNSALLDVFDLQHVLES